MGNANYATLLAYFNGISNEAEINSGTRIKIPILIPSTNTNGNAIYSVPAEQENYGIDIKIESNGDFQANNGDFDLINGTENLTQSILNRLTTASLKRIRYASYGIKASVGDPMSIKSYLLSSIEQTLAAEPRIKSIENIVLYGEGDKLYVEIFYTDINGSDNKVKGEL